MINQARNNNSLIRKRKAFSRLKKYIEHSVHYKTGMKMESIDPEELKKIKREIIARLRKERIRNDIISVTFLTLIIAGVTLLSVFLDKFKERPNLRETLSSYLQVPGDTERAEKVMKRE
ncbi:MAG: hypothetical protein ABIJ16_12145 [Bacteroidota bacterium]